MGQGIYTENVNALATEFIRFTLNQPAYVYLYEIAATGEVRLLFPNRVATDNFIQPEFDEGGNPKPVSFPEDFRLGFLIGPEGEYTVQALAALRPIFSLESGAQLFRLLGDDPEVVRESVELLIQQSGLTVAEWATDWTQYRVVENQPTTADYGQVRVRVQDPQGNRIPDALFKVEQVDEQGNPVGDRPLVDWQTVGEEYQGTGHNLRG